jgi:CRISPR-associated protein Cas5d
MRIRVWGDMACFTNPVFAADRQTFDVITPPAAIGILKSIYWKPNPKGFEFYISKIYLLSDISKKSLCVNELSDRPGKNGPVNIENSGNRIQRNTTILLDVNYILEFDMVLTDPSGDDKDNLDTLAKHRGTFKRRAKKGQYFRPPNLGSNSFPANFEYLDDNNYINTKNINIKIEPIIYGYNYNNKDPKTIFKNVEIKNGVFDIVNGVI